MPALGELLSAGSSRIGVGQSSVVPGTVFRVFDHQTTPPKVKYHIVVGISGDRVLLATVRINTFMNVNVYRDQSSQYRCLRIRTEKYRFLSHDSMIDCNHLVPHDLRNIETYISSHSDALSGNILPEDLEDIRLRLLEAPTITPEDKELFGISSN